VFSQLSTNEEEIFGIENEAFAGIDQIDFQEPITPIESTHNKSIDAPQYFDDSPSSETVRVAQQIVQDAAQQAVVDLQSMQTSELKASDIDLAACHQHLDSQDPEDQMFGGLLSANFTRTSSSTNTLTTASNSDYQTCASFNNSKMSPQPGLDSSTSGEDVTLYASAESQSMTESGRNSSASLCCSAASDTLIDDFVPSELDTVMDQQDLIKGTFRRHE
jgi:hypothetical protein